ncbi:MAG: hypothetical protein ACI9EF_002102 [Pseudohongiellaceae bacterium]|jgi:hypothetical protein
MPSLPSIITLIAVLAQVAAAQLVAPQVFATLEAARAHAAAVKAGPGLPPGGLVLPIARGAHYRTATFTLTAADSGAPGRPIVYRSEHGASLVGALAHGAPGGTTGPTSDPRARVIGGVPLDTTGFSLVTAVSPVWSRLDPTAQGQVQQFSLLAAGITSYGTLGDGVHGVDLSFDGELMTLARWPNIGAPLPTTVSAPSGTSFTYAGTRPERWLTAPDPWAWGLWFYDWRDNHKPVASISPVTQTITLGGTPDYGVGAEQPWYAENLLEELDTPGEWYVDRVLGVLYFWPPSDLDGAEVLVSTLPSRLIDVQGSSFVTFEDMVFELGWTEAVAVTGGRDVLLRRCEIRNTGTWGARFSQTSGGLQRCHVHHTGGRGVNLDGGDRASLSDSGLFVRDSHIHHFGNWRRTTTPAVRALGGAAAGGSADQRGAGCQVIGNWIHDGPHTGILYGGNNNRIERNEIHDVCQRTDDTGAIYSGRDWGSHGNVVRHNFVHHIANDLPANHTHGLYLDDCDSGDLVYGNVFYEVAGRAVMVGGGRDNLMRNNVIAKCGAAFYTDRRGTLKIDTTPGSSFNLLAKIQQFDYTQAPWSLAYPALAAILDDGWAAAIEPMGNEITANIGWQNGAWLQEGSFGGSGGFAFFTFGGNLQNIDPQFVDEVNLDLTLLPTSPAFTMPGFTPIPFARIGSKGW